MSSGNLEMPFYDHVDGRVCEWRSTWRSDARDGVVWGYWFRDDHDWWRACDRDHPDEEG
jgi:hypothetical protein